MNHEWHMNQNPGPLTPGPALYQSHFHSHGPCPCDLPAESVTKAWYCCFWSPFRNPISHSLAHSIRASFLKLNLILKIIALGLYCWCFPGSLLGVCAQTSPSGKYGGVNVTRRGLLTNGSWTPVWKGSHVPHLALSLDIWSWNEVGPWRKCSQGWSNWFFFWQHQLQNVSSYYLFPLPSFTPLNPLFLFPRVAFPLKIIITWALSLRLQLLGKPG